MMGLVACTPKYGQEACKLSTDCPSGQFCDTGCVPDGGSTPGTTVSALCGKQCASDADCANLGLKKPKCFASTCGPSQCADDPF